MSFEINGIVWEIVLVDPHSNVLFRSDGSSTIGMTDAETKTIYISEGLSNRLFKNVVYHEFFHAYCISYNIVIPIEYEELFCDIFSRYGEGMLELCKKLVHE